MPIYALQNGSSDIQGLGAPFDYVRIAGSDTVSTQTQIFTVPAGGSINLYFLTQAGHPNNDDWEDAANISCEWAIISSNSALRTRCRVGRVNARNSAIQELGAFTAFQNQTPLTVLTFNTTTPTWSTNEFCTNRLIIQYQINNLDLSNPRNCNIAFGLNNALINSDITENSSGCRRIFIA